MGNTDSIPVVSQVKSLFQVMSGDEKGARRTQENFRDTGIVASQVTSLVHAIGGNEKKAKEVQKKFVKELDAVSDSLPIVGHVKGGIYYATGDKERGENAMKGASGSLVSMAAGTVGGSVSEVLTANWQHLSPPQTVSNLVSLFVILRLILWNDKNGRNYSRELCIATEFDHIKRCQESLMKTLREMDNHLTLKKSDSEYVITPNLKMKGISRNSTRTMIRVMASLYGILDSMAKGDEIGIAWLAELCVFEDISTLGICEKEVVHKLKELSNQAFTLGEERKRRIKRGGSCNKRQFNNNLGTDYPRKRDKTGSNYHPRDGQSVSANVKSTGSHNMVRKYNKGRVGRYESNHVPAFSSFPEGSVRGSLPAHSLPYEIHQIAMAKVGTSKRGKIATTLRNYERQLIEKGKMADAIKLDFAESYGRANTRANFDNIDKTTNFKPALVKYKNELKGVVDEHLKQKRINKVEADNLYKFLDDETNAWNSKKDWNWWMRRAENNYVNIVTENGLPILDNMNVPLRDRLYG